MIRIILFIYLYLFSIPAHAYVDPGTGGLIIQAIAAGLAAVGAFWTGLKFKIFGKKKDNNPNQENPDENKK